jgi:hypothetical protein
LKKRCRAINLDAWSRIVAGANPLKSVRICAPTACPPSLSPRIALATSSSRSTGSSHQTGSGAIMAAT